MIFLKVENFSKFKKVFNDLNENAMFQTCLSNLSDDRFSITLAKAYNRKGFVKKKLKEKFRSSQILQKRLKYFERKVQIPKNTNPSEYQNTIRPPHTCVGDATRLWNEAPSSIKMSKTISAAKKETKKFLITNAFCVLGYDLSH